MSVTVAGSIAYDRVKTPFGQRERMLGGAATHFALAASFFDEVRVVGPVGDDFADEDLRVLQTRGRTPADPAPGPGGKPSSRTARDGGGPTSAEPPAPPLGASWTSGPRPGPP